MGLFEVTDMWMLAIGKTTIHSIWIGLLILALLRLVQAYIPLRLSGLRYRISVSALLLLFFSVIAAFLMLFEPESPKQDVLSSSGTLALISGILVIESNGEAVLNIHSICTLFGYFYFTGILLMLLRSVASLRYLRRLKSKGTLPGPEWQHRFSGICQSMGIMRSVNFLESTLAKGPLLVGYLKPAVIVPAGMLSMLPVSQIETIIMHELYHLKRRDYLVNIMQLFIEGVLFYHPVVWIISGFIRTEREHCCDDRVLNSTDNPVIYAKALIHIAEQQKFTRLAPGAVGSAKHQFYSRIKRILNQNTMKTNMRDKVLSLALVAGSLIILLTVSGFSEGPAFIRIDKMTNEIRGESMDPPVMKTMDTIPQENRNTALEELEEEALQEALEEIEEIDWDAIKEEMEAVHLEALEEIDWEEFKTEMEHSLSEMKLDMEEIKQEIELSMNEIDWDEIREDIKENLEKSKLVLDSIKVEMDL